MALKVGSYVSIYSHNNQDVCGWEGIRIPYSLIIWRVRYAKG